MKRWLAVGFLVWSGLSNACAPQSKAHVRSPHEVTYGTGAQGEALRGSALTPALSQALKDTCAAHDADLDGRLGGMALAMAEGARENLAAPSLRAVNAQAEANGVVDPTPEVWLAAAGSANELARAIGGQRGERAATGMRTHCGGAVVRRQGRWIAALVWSKRILTLADVPGQIAEGRQVALKGKLSRGYREPVLAITSPAGKVERVPLGQGPGFERRLALAGRGEHRLEILAEGGEGVTVAANFPVAVGNARRAARAADDEGAAPERSSEEVREALIARVARERRKQGLQPLTLSEPLAAVALAHSQDMLEHHFIAHTSKSSGEPPERLVRAGLTSTIVLENIGRGYSAEEIHQGLMESPGHRGNILHSDATELGVGVVAEVEGERLAFIATELFAHLVEPLDAEQAQSALAEALAQERRKAKLTQVQVDRALSQVAQSAAKTLAGAPSERHEALLAAAIRDVQAPPRGLTKLGATLVISPDLEQIAKHPALLTPALGFLGLGLVTHKTTHGQTYVVVLLLGER